MLNDFVLRNHGSIAILVPVNKFARKHLNNNMPADAQMFGNGYAIEPRYVDAIVADLLDNGFTIGG